MKESFAHCLSGPINLDEQERERPVDRLHALASAARDSHLSSLGVSFLALRTANRADEYSRAFSKLDWFMSRKKRGIPAEMRQKIVRQALHETIIIACPRCQGTGEVKAAEIDGAQPMRPCPPDPEGCGGHGMRRYSDLERMEALGVGKHEYRGLEAHIADALGFLNAAEAEAVRTARRLLEKYF